MTETENVRSDRTRPATDASDARVGVGRAWRIRFRRGLAWLLLAALAVAGVLVLLAHVSLWAASWSGLAHYLRMSIIVLGPVAVAFACWEAGQDRRRRIRELLGTTPQSAWRRELTGFSVIAVAVAVGYLVVFAGAATVVAPAATYAGGRWPATLALGVVAMVAMASVGWAVGRAVGFRLIAPVMGIVSYVAVGYASYFGGGWIQLLPPGTGRSGGRLTGQAIAGGIAFFLLVAVAVLTVSTARRWRAGVAAVVPAALAIAVAVPLSAGNSQSWWEADPGAQQLVCTDSGRVCVWNSHSGLLDTVAARADPLLAAITTSDGPQYRLTEPAFDRSRPLGTAEIPITLTRQATISGRSLTLPGIVDNAVASATYPDCPMPEQTSGNPVASPWDETMSEVQRAASYAISTLGDPFAAAGINTGYSTASTDYNIPSPEPGTVAARLLDQYRAAPESDRRAWLSAEIQAAKACDREALHQLAQGIER